MTEYAAPAVPEGAMPRHIAFIMDGNGRWAKEQGLARTDGHRRGVDTVRTVLRCARQWNIPWVTLYAFSSENWRRPEAEVNTLFTLLAQYVQEDLPEFLESDARIHLLGDPEPIPRFAREPLEIALAQTRHCRTYHVNVALNYGARAEILRAIQRLHADGADPADLDADTFARYLDVPQAPDPDLLVRTSGEVRISNFLLWQLAYAELYFTPTMWPDFGPPQLRAAIEDFARRKRRFGFTDEQLEHS